MSEVPSTQHSLRSFKGDTLEEVVPARTKESRGNSLSKQLTGLTYDGGRLVVDSGEFDLRRILHTYTKQAESHGVKLRTVGVTFEGLFVYGVDQLYAFLPTVADILQLPLTIYRGIRDSKNRPKKAILKNMYGTADSGEMVLVLGRPGAGCSTFLKALSGTDLHSYTGLEGTVEFDGIPQTEMIKRFKQDLIYCPELDTHFPHLTVQQTLDFAIACRMPRDRVNNLSKQEYIQFQREMLATVFGLTHAYHTKVGNEYVRGCSGGERKRVSIAEAMACQGSVYCWDNATRGLDASTALEYAQAIRTSTQFTKCTAFVSLYQASENIYNTFDKVSVLYKGRQVYFGPISEAKAFFENMGWECPPRQTTAEFLTAVTDPIGRFPKPGFENKVPQTADEFESYWLASPEFNRLKEQIAAKKASVSRDETHAHLSSSVKQEKQRFERSGSIFTINYFEQLKLNVRRSFQNIWGDKAYTIIQIVAAILQSLIVGSLYYNTPDNVTGSFSRGGVCFFAVLYLSLMGLAEVSNSFQARPILLKQRNYSLYHPSAFAVADVISTAPVNMLIAIPFCLIMYFLANLKREAGKFFVFLLFAYLTSLTMGSLFKGVAAWNKTISAANAFSGVLILAALMYSSFMIQTPSMHPWFRWIAYINPVLYAFEAMITTEFHGRHMPCDTNYLIPHGPGYSPTQNNVCGFKGSLPGQLTVDGDRYVKLAFEYKFTHVWRNFGIMIGFFLFFTFCAAVGFEVVRPVSGGVDRLFFLRGKTRSSTMVMPGENRKDDSEENGSSADPDLEKTPNNQLYKNSYLKEPSEHESVMEGLRSRDLFVWKDIDYVIPYMGGRRKLLDSVSGYCVPGKLTALMGESGAGKTTLLNTLAQRIEMGTVTGEFLVNGKPLDVSFSRRTGYVQQQDIHLAQTTVREALLFSAKLRRSRSVPDSEKAEYVDKIIDVLEMNEYADAIVGDLGSGLNVEQRKKLTIGVELVAKPSLLLFLDEPTSGLDSQSAWAIVKLLRSLANAGQSILCTIHQPSATLFEEFDRLLLLRKGGQTVYFGDIGQRSLTILSYFERNGARKCSDSENPAEYILEAIGAGATAVVEEDWFDIWEKSPEKIHEKQVIEDLIQDGLRIDNEKDESGDLANVPSKELKSHYATPIVYQYGIVLVRSFRTYWRSPDYVMSKIFLMIMSGLFIGFTFFGLKHTVTGMQNGMFCAFLSVVVSAPLVNQIQEQCIHIREIFEGREKMSLTYRWWIMVLALFVTEMPYMIVGGTLMFVSLYFPTRTDTLGPHSGVFYLSSAIFLQTFNISFAFMLCFFAPDVSSAAVFASFFFSFIVGFCGVVQPTNLMPGFWTFMYKVSPYTYVIQNLVSSFLHDRPVKCGKNELAILNSPSGMKCAEYLKPFVQKAGGYLVNPDASQDCAYCQYNNADQYLLTIGVKYKYVWRNIGFFCAYIIFNTALCLVLYKAFRLTLWRRPNFLKRKKASQ